MSCLVCGATNCICSNIVFAPPNQGVGVSVCGPNQSMTFGPGKETVEDPFIESSTGTISVRAKLDYGTINLIELYLEGKDFETNKEAYLDIILKLPWVAGNNLKACQTFERLKQLFSVFGGK